MTPPAPPCTSQVTGTSSNVAYDTPAAEAIAAAAAEAAPPSPMPDQQDECVLCCYPLPLKQDETLYKECCGQVICRGCIIAQRRTLVIGTNVKKPVAGSKEEELEFIMIYGSKLPCLCPFCRAKEPTNDKEFLNRLWKRIDEYKDPTAIGLLGQFYLKGNRGLSKNPKKAEKLFQMAYDLGDVEAAYMLSELYSKHIPDQVRMMKYVDEGARQGHTHCIFQKADCEAESGNFEEATGLFMIAARLGHDISMKILPVFYRMKLLSKESLTTALRAHKAANDKAKSGPREYAIRCDAFRE